MRRLCVTGICCQWSVATVNEIFFLVLRAGFPAGDVRRTDSG